MSSASIEQVSREVFWPGHSGRAFLSRGIDWIWRNHRSAIVLAAELLLAAAGFIGATMLVAESRPELLTLRFLAAGLSLLLVSRLAGLSIVRLYRRSLRSASIPDLISIVAVATATSLANWVVVLRLFAGLKMPAALVILDWCFVVLLWGGLHFGARVVKAQRMIWRKSGKRVIVVGAGDAGITLIKALAQEQAGALRVVALVDDDPEKWRRSICGVLVAGGTGQLEHFAARYRAEEILICIPSATVAQIQHILSGCRRAGIPVKTLPSLTELAGGKVSLRDLRSPRIEDLLQRERISLDVEETRGVVGGKIVLVTGAGGSIGSELSRQIAAAGPAKLLLLDKSENSLFYIHRELCERMDAQRVKPQLVDLVCRNSVREVLMRERPDVIFHAAAHKHVGLLELHPQEAIRNNVLGTRNIAEAAIECGATRFVNISTDKAVRPRSYLGLSKKLTELCIRDLAHDGVKRKFSNVRFGNVAGSTGSVMRLFWEQIQKGDPIRVTDPRATRYFMSVREAVHLILRAAALGDGGETFVFEMGDPVNIYELAKTMMLFAGLRAEGHLAIEFTGLNEGEKVSEDLWEEWERPVATEDSRILRINDQATQLAGMREKIERMEELLGHGDQDALLDYLDAVVPGFRENRKKEVPARGRVDQSSKLESMEAA
jgi:FlaA1/EpsC-like NDP-sugar epimerase